MNPNSIRTQSDRMKVREAYLANLDAQQRNLDKTINAVSVLKQTGQPPIAPQDTRSITEKFSDIGKLKTNLRRLLTGLTDGAQASEIMSSLTDAEVQMVSSLYPDIEKELKSRFALGVPAPIFIEFIRRYIRDYGKNLGLASGNQEVIASELRMTRDMLSQLIPSQAIMRELIQAIASAPETKQRQDALAAAQQLTSVLPDPNAIIDTSALLGANETAKLADLTDAALKEVPTSAQVQGLTKDITNALRSGNVKVATNILDEALQYIKLQNEEVQKLKEVSDLLITQAQSQFQAPLEQAEVPQSEIAKIARIIGSKEKNVKTQVGTQINVKGEKVPVFETQKALVGKATTTEADMKLAQMVFDLDRADGPDIPALNPTKKAAINYYEYIAKRDEGKPLSPEDRLQLDKLTREEIIQLIVMDKEQGKLSFALKPKPKQSSKAAAVEATAAQTGGPANLGSLSPAQLAQESVDTNSLIPVDIFESLPNNEQLEYLFRINASNLFARNPQVSQAIDEIIARSPGSQELLKFYQQTKTFTGMGFGSKMYKRATTATKGGKKIMFGNGLVKKQTRTFPDKIDFESGVPIDKSYIPFGRYVINKHKLGDGKLMIKTIKGGAIPKIPTLGISPALGGIIKKMIGGGMPTYNEMKSLSEEEQNTLYKVFKLSQVDKADLLPSPDKTKEEEEMNRFMILKGQVQAGNDSKELIKEFKLMLMKFINGGKIPKSQGMDIVCDLMALGY